MLIKHSYHMLSEDLIKTELSTWDLIKYSYMLIKHSYHVLIKYFIHPRLILYSEKHIGGAVTVSKRSI